MIILWVIVLGEISRTIYHNIINHNTQKANSQLAVGKRMKFIGEIKNDNQFPLYTHSITNDNWEKVYVKSTSINLNTQKGEIEIVWEIKDYNKDAPIIEVDTIKFKDQWLIIKNNAYLFVNDLLYLDFSNQPQLSANKTEKDINILFEWKKIFSVERFLCSKILKNKSCNYLIQDYNSNQKESFDSYRGYTFYKHGTGLRTAFDGDTFWYIFKGIEDDVLLSVSSMVRIIDKNFITKNKGINIKETCKNNNWYLDHFSFAKTEYKENNLISITIDWETNKGKDMECELTFDIRNEREIIKTNIK